MIEIFHIFAKNFNHKLTCVIHKEMKISFNHKGTQKITEN